MRYIGLDVHKRVVQVHVIDDRGQKIDAFRFDLTADTLTDFARRHLDDDCAVALEATTNTWAVVDVLTPFCPRIVVSNPMRTKAIASAKIKTDKVDAEVLAQLLRCDYLPPVWTPDAHTRAARSLASRRSALTRQSIQLKNRLHSVLHQRLIQAPMDPFTEKGQAWLASLNVPPLVRGEIDTLHHLLAVLREEQQGLRVLIDQAAYVSADIRLLMTLPGVDAATAQALVAAIGDVSRFRGPEKLAAYLGLVPSVRQSADKAYHGRITKQGNSNARWLLVQAAQVAAKHPGPLGYQFSKLEKKKTRNIAIVATARKLAVLVWHLLTHRQPYRYAIPSTVETKLARLRVSQEGKHKTGPRKGHPRSAAYGTGQRTRQKKTLDSVLQQEGLPATTPAAPGEVRRLADIGLTDFAAQLQTSGRRPSRTGIRAAANAVAIAPVADSA